MKTKIYTIIGLGSLLLVMLSMLALGVGSASHDNLTDEEMSAYKSRKEVVSLTTPEAKASYALGMARLFSSPNFLDGKSSEFLALYYALMSEPANTYYYMGQGSTPADPEKLSSILTGVDIPLNAESYVAGYAQTMEHKIHVPKLTGNEGMNYFNKVAYGAKDFENVKYGERDLMDVLDYDKFKDYTANDSENGGVSPEELKKANEEYGRLMRSGQYDKAQKYASDVVSKLYDYKINKYKHSLIHSDYDAKEEEAKKAKALEELTNQHKEVKAYMIHGYDQYYKDLQADLNAARLELKAAQEQKTDAEKFHYFRSKAERKKDISAADTRLEAATKSLNQLEEKQKAYTKIDDKIGTTSDHDKGIISEFDKKTKTSLAIRERIHQLDDYRAGRGLTIADPEEFHAAEKEWLKEKEELLKALDKNEEDLQKLIGDDQKDLLINHKKKVKEAYDKMGKKVTEAETSR